MRNILSVAFLSFALLVASVSTAQTKKSRKLKQEDPKKKEQKDSTKSSGTRMAINSSEMPTKGKKNTSSNKEVSNPNAEPKKDGGKKTEEKK